MISGKSSLVKLITTLICHLRHKMPTHWWSLFVLQALSKDFISSEQKPLGKRMPGMNYVPNLEGSYCGNTSMFSCRLSEGWNNERVFYLEFFVKLISLAD